jgi:hypothetical protein
VVRVAARSQAAWHASTGGRDQRRRTQLGHATRHLSRGPRTTLLGPQIANILGAVPNSLQPKVKAALHTIMNAENKQAPDQTIDQFEIAYGAKYPKATDKLLKDRELLVTRFEFPAEHWIHLITTNAIESTFATVKLRIRKTKGAGSRTAGIGDGLQVAGCYAGTLALPQRTPPGRARSRWGTFVDAFLIAARGPVVRRMTSSHSRPNPQHRQFLAPVHVVTMSRSWCHGVPASLQAHRPFLPPDRRWLGGASGATTRPYRHPSVWSSVDPETVAFS